MADVDPLAAAPAAAVRLDAPTRSCTGAWLGIVLRTPAGPLWTDFELTCVGPRELGLTCGWPRSELMPLTAWTYQLAASQPAYLDLARTRLAWALEGCETPDFPFRVCFVRGHRMQSR